jgi:hypothetical protein
MSTTTLTTVASDYDCRIRHVWFNVRSSTATTGSTWEGWGEWRVVRGGTVIHRISKTLDFTWCTKNDGDIVYVRYVDKAGNFGSWESYTITVDAAANATLLKYINGTTGNDSNDGSSGNPWLTCTKFKTEAAAAVASGAEIIGMFSGSATYAWAGTQGWDGGTTPCRVQFVWDGTGTKPLMTWNTNVFGFITGYRQSVVVEGFDLDGNYASGIGTCFSPERDSASSTRSACNSIFLNCDIHDWYQGFHGGDAWITADPTARRDSGNNEFLHVEDCTFDANNEYHMWGMDYMRYFSMRNVYFGNTTGAANNLIHVRMYSLGDHYWEDVESDPGTTASFRTPANLDTDSATRYGSIVRYVMKGTDAGLNGYSLAAAGTGTAYIHDLRFVDCTFDVSCPRFEINAHGQTNTIDVDRVQFWNCTIQNNVDLKATATTGGTYDKIEFVQCAFVAETYDGGTYGPYFSCTDHTRYVDSGFRFVGNAILWPDTGDDPPRVVLDGQNMTRAQLAGKFAECNYNHAGKNSAHSIRWAAHNDNGFSSSLSDWQGATVHDDNSSSTQSTGFNLTNNGLSGVVNARMTTDTGGDNELIGTGYPHAYWVDGDGYVYDDDAGPYEYGAATLPDDPSLGAGQPTRSRWHGVPFSPMRSRGIF